MTSALDESCHNLLPTSSNTYGKWFDGTRNPENVIWGLVVSHFDEDGFVDNISKNLNDSELKNVMSRFGIELHEGNDPDKRLFAFALAKQFHALAQGNGNADDVVKKYYNPDAHIISFPEYAARTKAKYEKTETPFSDGEERLLGDIYVCNKLSSRLAATKNRHSRTQEKVIINATLDLIAEYSERVILVANGGMGKSMMLQHLFLESIQNHQQTGILPIIIELRDFSENNNLFNDYIIRTAETYDRNLTFKKLEELMCSGKCQILMDGADEIDPSDVNAFQRQIADLSDRYPYNQYVVASRECDIIKGVKGFSKLYLRPFNKEESFSLVEKLLLDSRDENTKTGLIDNLESSFLQKHKVFASNPMLLTFVVMKYPTVDPFRGKKRLFYRTAYDAIVSGHDEEKKGYSRVFRSAQNAEEFTKVFRELCAITYIKHEIEFDLDTFDEYFNNLVAKDSLENPKIMTSKNFIHDACATACMMYEEDIKLVYIDPGFQEYLFAQYYFSAAPGVLEKLSKSLWDVAETDFNGNDAFEMLYEFSPEKFEKYFIKPYLLNIFSNKSEIDGFISFIRYGFREFEYQLVENDTVTEYVLKNSAEWIPLKPIILESSSVILSILLRLLGIYDPLKMESFESGLDYKKFLTMGVFGEIYSDPSDGKIKIIPRRLLWQGSNDFKSYEKTNVIENYVRDDSQNLVCFGYEYKIDFEKVLEEQHNYSALINALKMSECELFKTYSKVKGYYEELLKKYRD